MPQKQKNPAISRFVVKNNKLEKTSSEVIQIRPTKTKRLDLDKIKISEISTSINVQSYTLTDFNNLRTIAKLKQHKVILNSIGIEDFSKLGNLHIQGNVMPSIGAYFSDVQESTLQDDKGKAIFQTKHEKINELNIRAFKNGKFKKIQSNSSIQILPAATSNFSLKILSSAFPIGFSYIAASTLYLDSYTTIVLQENITNLIIIADQIITDSSNINITWSQPSLPIPQNLNNPSGVPNDQPGKNGEQGLRGIDGRFAPTVEVWTLNPIRNQSNSIVTNALIANLEGQQGGQGGQGQNGGQGGQGSNGHDSIPAFLDCKSGPGSGRDGGDGGSHQY